MKFLKLPKFKLLTLVASLLMASCVSLLNATIPSSGYSIVKNIPYGKEDRQKLDIYVPDQMAEGHPVIVFYYGGSWRFGSKDDYLFLGQAFASKGIMTVVADYRLYPQVYYPDFMYDVADAFAWTHNHIAEHGGNADNVFAMGHSAGAYNAVMLTLDRDYLKQAGGNDHWIRGTIGLSGPYDFLPLTDPKLIDMFSTREIHSTQPISYVRKNVPPMLLLTGDDDSDVDPRNSLKLTAKLQELGNSVMVKIYPGIAHIGIVLALADGFRSRAPVLDDVADFITAHVQKDEHHD